MFHKQTVRDVELSGKTILLRANFDVPLEGGEVHDDFRIQASLPTIKYLLEEDCKVIIISHLGRPKNGYEEEFSLRPVAQRLANLLNQEVRFVDDCIGKKVIQTVEMSPGGSVILLENTRFHEGEVANDETFAEELARSSRASYFVQDGFGVVHRAQASTEAITHYLPSVAGISVESEYLALEKVISEPRRPLVAILGGAKVSDKIKVIERFIETSNHILIGGAMANTFLAYHGKNMGKSLVEPDQKEVIDRIYQLIREKVGDENVDNFLQLPVDLAVGYSTNQTERRIGVSADEVGDDQLALDIGDETIRNYQKIIASAGSVIWNGPVGYSEVEAFSKGSVYIAELIASRPELFSVIGGGDTADFVRSWSKLKSERFSYISTGGGASLDLLSGKKLPGIESLLDAREEIS